MKVLIRKEADSPKVTDILTIAEEGGVMRSLDGQHEATEGVVMAVAEKPVKRYLATRALRDDKYPGWDKDEMREMRSFGKMLSTYDDGDEVKPEIDGLMVRIPSKEREREPVEVGDIVAFCETISPAYLLNARATVTAVSGQKITVTLDEGDYDRLCRAGRDRFQQNIKTPVGTVEKVS